MSAVDLLKKLVGFPSITAQKNVSRELLVYLQQELRALNMPVCKLYESNGFYSLVATTRQTKRPRLWLSGHVDVVAASSEEFTPRIKNGKLFGRGTLDDKCAAAIYVEALRLLGDKLPDYSVGIMLTSDEEIGGHNGTRYLLEEAGYSGEAALVMDSGTGWSIDLRAKGGIHATIEATGKGGHASMPWLGENALEKLITVINGIQAELSIPKKPAEQEYGMTFNIGRITGGLAANQIPDFAEGAIDIRFPDSQDYQKIQKAFAKYRSKDVRIQITTDVKPVVMDQNNPAITAFTETLREYGIQTHFRKSNGATDARFFYAHGIPVVVSQPLGGNLHTDNEWIDIAALRQAPEIVAAYIAQIARA